LKCRGDSGVLSNPCTRIPFLYTGGQEHSNCPKYDSGSYGYRRGRQGPSAPIDDRSSRHQRYLTLPRTRVHPCARKIHSPLRYCMPSVALISGCVLYIVNPPRSYVYAITEFVDCPVPGWMPYARSATGASVDFIDRECDRSASTLNCMGKYGRLPPVSFHVRKESTHSAEPINNCRSSLDAFVTGVTACHEVQTSRRNSRKVNSCPPRTVRCMRIIDRCAIHPKLLTRIEKNKVRGIYY